jgi:hypothetical protein
MKNDLVVDGTYGVLSMSRETQSKPPHPPSQSPYFLCLGLCRKQFLHVTRDQ